MRALEVARATYGAVALLAPDRLEGRLLAPADRTGRTAVRVLGARHLAQAVLTARGSEAVRRLGGAVDLLHALSMLVLADRDRGRRAAAATSAATAVLLGIGELR